MAESYSLPNRHFELEHCVNFLESTNSSAQLEHPAISRYKALVTSGPDTELLRFQSSLQIPDVKKILIYLRNFDICDLADCERISSPHLFPTSDLMVAELVTMISTKDLHAFWYFVHAVKKGHGREGLFEFFHGNINCCVCEEVQAKEKEIDDTLSLALSLPEANESTFCKLMLKIKFKLSVREDIKKELKKLEAIAKGYLGEFRREFGQPLGKYFTRIKNTFKNIDSLPLNEQRPNTDNEKEDVVISMPNEPLEQPNEGSESSRYEDVSEQAVPDEEAGYKKPIKVKPKLGANCEAPAVVEGRKKFIAFLCVSCITLYSYGVDSLIKLF